MKKYKEITGNRYGKLVAVRYDRTEKLYSKNDYHYYRVYFLFKCDCGNEVIKYSTNVVNGQGQACKACIKIARKATGGNNIRKWMENHQEKTERIIGSTLHHFP